MEWLLKLLMGKMYLGVQQINIEKMNSLKLLFEWISDSWKQLVGPLYEIFTVMPLLMLHFYYMLLIFFTFRQTNTRYWDNKYGISFTRWNGWRGKKIDSNIILSFLLRYKLHYSNRKLYKGLLKSVRISQRINSKVTNFENLWNISHNMLDGYIVEKPF